MSKRTVLQRVWAVCSSSVRKSLQGLDNFSASGMEAVDALEKLVDKFVDCGKTQQWAREIKQQLRFSKQYLKGDYKVGAYFIIMRCLCKCSKLLTMIHGYLFLSLQVFFMLNWWNNSLQFTVIRTCIQRWESIKLSFWNVDHMRMQCFVNIHWITRLSFYFLF